MVVMGKLINVFLVVGISFVLTSCVKTTTTNNEEKHNQETTAVEQQQASCFSELLSQINSITLPFSFYCGIDNYKSIEEYSINCINTLQIPYQENIGIAGKLPSFENKEFVIYTIPGDIIYPYLFVYNESGEFLDSLFLHIAGCDGDDSLIISNETTINTDYSIEMIDTTQYIHFNNQMSIVYDSAVIITKKLILNSDGKYKTDMVNKRKFE